MTVTIFVPDWDANEEMRAKAEKRKGYENFVASFTTPSGQVFDIAFSEGQSCDVIQLKVQVTTLPDGLKGVPMRAIYVVKHNSPVTYVVDGTYRHGNLNAIVETYVKDGVTQQSFVVWGVNGATVEEVNQWFNDLRTGMHADKNLNPITYPDPFPVTDEVAAKQ